MGNWDIYNYVSVYQTSHPISAQLSSAHLGYDRIELDRGVESTTYYYGVYGLDLSCQREFVLLALTLPPGGFVHAVGFVPYAIN
jgi:hypothetical protein